MSSPDALRLLKVEVRDMANAAISELKIAASGVQMSDAPSDMIRPVYRLTKKERDQHLIQVRVRLEEIIKLCQ